MNKDYYRILGLSREAKNSKIKSAYRKLALQHHPDRNFGSKEAEEKFKDIAEAYAVLGDSEKRRAYDNFGYTQFRGRFSQEDIFRGFDLKDLFREFGLRFDDNISRGFFYGRGRGKGCGRKRGRCARSFSQ